MKRFLPLIILGLALFSSCEDIYQAKLEEMEELLVIEARLVYGQSTNSVKLYKTIGFNDMTSPYPPVSGADVTLLDDKSVPFKLKETEKGNYQLTQALLPERKYKLRISSGGEVYVSTFQKIPDMPSLNNVSLIPSEQLLPGTTDQSASGMIRIAGAQLYVDVNGRGSENHYRFTGRKICQYYYNRIPNAASGLVIPVYAWYSAVPPEPYNIAAPPDYSVATDIRKHPLVFLEKSVNVYIHDTTTIFMGWIYICYQHAISEQTYQFYSDLKKQLSASGKIFDPLYTQASGNISCTTHPEKTVLGNFEIASVKEYRFYVEHIGQDKYYLQEIPFFWNIPQGGKVEDYPPPWWEYRGKKYPAGLAGWPDEKGSYDE